MINGKGSASDATHWYTVQTKPRKENLVYNYLCANEFETFYPSVVVKPVNPRAAKIRPYFPSYVFVRADLDVVGEGSLQWFHGAVGLVRFGGEPAIVPDHFIYELEHRIEAIKAAGGLHLDGLKRGDQVRITSGPFADCEALFDLRLNDGERVQVFLQWLGRQLKIQIDASAVSKPRR
jgi:transcription antitermination factor NusG